MLIVPHVIPTTRINTPRHLYEEAFIQVRKEMAAGEKLWAKISAAEEPELAKMEVAPDSLLARITDSLGLSWTSADGHIFMKIVETLEILTPKV